MHLFVSLELSRQAPMILKKSVESLVSDHGSGVCKTNSDLVSGAVFPEIKEDIGSPEGHVQQSCEVVDGPRVPEVTELR